MKSVFQRMMIAVVASGSVAAVMLVYGADAEACALHSSAPPVSSSAETDRESGDAEQDEDHEQGEQDEGGIAVDGDREHGLTGRVQLLGAGGGLRFGSDDTGRAHLREGNLMLHGELWFHPSWGVAASAPLARRSLELPSGATERLQGLGDMSVELAWRTTADAGVGMSSDDAVGQPRSSDQRFGVQLRLGALLPTSPLMTHDDDRWYHPDVQLGAGVVIPRAAVGVTYFHSSTIQMFAGADAMWAPESPDGVQRGATARFEPGVQWRPADQLSLLVSTPVRYQARTRTDGDWEVATGGLLWSLVPQVQWEPVRRLSVQAGPTLPVVQALRGEQRESVGFTAATSWRF